jgi:hypothetical protein
MFSMDPETQRLLRKLVAKMDEAHQYTCDELPEELLQAMVESEDRDDDSSDDDDPDTHLWAVAETPDVFVVWSAAPPYGWQDHGMVPNSPSLLGNPPYLD